MWVYRDNSPSEVLPVVAGGSFNYKQNKKESRRSVVVSSSQQAASSAPSSPSISLKQLIMLQRISANYASKVQSKFRPQPESEPIPVPAEHKFRKSFSGPDPETLATFRARKSFLAVPETKTISEKAFRPRRLPRMGPTGADSLAARMHLMSHRKQAPSVTLMEWSKMSLAINDLLDGKKTIEAEVSEMEKRRVQMMSAKQEIIKTKLARPKFLKDTTAIIMLSKRLKAEDG